MKDSLSPFNFSSEFSELILSNLRSGSKPFFGSPNPLSSYPLRSTYLPVIRCSSYLEIDKDDFIYYVWRDGFIRVNLDYNF